MTVSTPLSPLPPHPPLSRCRSVACLAVAALSAVAAFTPDARAQIRYVEPPDLAPGPVGTAVGTASEGVSTVTGEVSATWDSSGSVTGDRADAFAFVVPVGLEATSIYLIVDPFTCSNCSVQARLLVNGLPFVNISGSGSVTLPISVSGGNLPAGTYSVELSADRSTPGIAGSASLRYQFRISVPPSNDACSSAVSVGLGATPFTTSGATTDGPDHPELCNFFGDPGIVKDVWFTFTPADGGTLTVNTCGSLYDTELAIYQGTSCDNLATTILACNDDNDACGDGSYLSSMQAVVSAGQSYLIRVGGFVNGPNSGAGTLNLGLDSTGACCRRATGGCTVINQADCAALACSFVGFGVACSPSDCTACPADFNNSGVLSVQDIFDFLAAYFAGCP